MTPRVVDHAAIAAEIKRFVAATFLFDVDSDATLNDDSNLFEAGVIDSYGLLELILHLEPHFGVKLTDEDLTSGKLSSVRGITGVVLERLRSR